MEHITIALLVLFISLFVGHFAYESFIDVSGTKVTLSLSDLMSLIGKASKDSNENTNASLDNITAHDKYYATMKGSILDTVKGSVKDELLSGSLSGLTSGNLEPSCDQGSDYLRNVPAANDPAYIRKDSIPCYACNIPY